MSHSLNRDPQTDILPPPEEISLRLQQTQEAFDSVASDYDGPRGNNLLIQEMRAEMWRWLDATFSAPAHLLDLGCGTGLDAVRMAQTGHRITATDWSGRMVERTWERAVSEGVADRVRTLAVGSHELHRIAGDAAFDGAYSNLGPLNCIPDLTAVSSECARLIKPGGTLVFSVIGRICPWEIAYYMYKRQWARARVRFARGTIAVGMNRRTVWTRYYRPREFYRAFERDFTLAGFRGLCLFAPPPYLTWMRQRHPLVYQRLWRVDRLCSGWPLLRNMGDHFLVVMRRRSPESRKPE